MTGGRNTRLLYLNHTGIFAHWGCLAVAHSHLSAMAARGLNPDIIDALSAKAAWQGDRVVSQDYLRESEFSSRIESCDAVLINGEGTLHHGRGLHLLAIAEFAQSLGKPCYLINCTIEAIDGFDDVLRGMRDLVCREAITLRALQRAGIPARFAFDDFINAGFTDTPADDHKGATILTDWHPHVDAAVFPIVQKAVASLDPGFAPLDRDDAHETWHQSVATFGTAGLLLSGRYHGLYMSALAGTPFVALPCNSHKVLGLIKSSGLPLPYCERPVFLDNALKYARQNPSLFEDFRSLLQDSRGDTAFEVLDADFGLTPTVSPVDAQSLARGWMQSHAGTALAARRRRDLNNRLKTTHRGLQENRRLLSEHRFEEHRLRNPITYHKTHSERFDHALRAFAFEKLDVAASEFKALADKGDKRARRQVGRVLGELGRLEEWPDSWVKDGWANVEYERRLDSGDLQSAFDYLATRPLDLLATGLIPYDDWRKADDFRLELEGGVGDQLRQLATMDWCERISGRGIVYCDARIIGLLSPAYPGFVFRPKVDRGGLTAIASLSLMSHSQSHEITGKRLSVDAELGSFWNRKLRSLLGDRPIVGISPGSHIPSAERRSNIFGLDMWSDAMADKTLSRAYIDLSANQREDHAGLARVGLAPLHDIEGFAAAMSACSLIVTPANSTLDIAGALGLPVLAIARGAKHRWRVREDGTDLFHPSVRWMTVPLSVSKQDLVDAALRESETLKDQLARAT